MKLLIKPLYRDRPEIGARELLQNALDAVHELRQWAADHEDPELKKIPLSDQEADVLVSIDEDDSGDVWMTVRDKGIGMTIEVVRDYFLKAGASYRKSTAWRKEFEDEGGSKVLRSGRFGIGALAAFLLGERIEVFTRHVSSPREDGIHFTASIVDDLIELKRVPLQVVGTTVGIRLSRDAAKAFGEKRETYWRDEWDWFTLDDPRVERRTFGKTLGQALHFPRPGQLQDFNWTEFSMPGYQGVLWTLVKGQSILVCNGIIVSRHFGSHYWGRGVPFGSPTLSVFDLDGRIPLDLVRTGLVSDPFKSELLVEFVCELCALLLLHGPERVLDVPWMNLDGPACCPFLALYEDERFFLCPVCFGTDGFSLFHYWSFEKAGMPCRLFLVEDQSLLSQIQVDVSFLNAVCVVEGFGILERHYVPVQEVLRGLLGGMWVPLTPPGHERAFMDVDMPWRFDSTPFTEALDDILDSPIIPYDPAERRQRLPKAFAKLEKYLKKWEPENLTGWRLDTVRWFRGEPIPEE